MLARILCCLLFPLLLAATSSNAAEQNKPLPYGVYPDSLTYYYLFKDNSGVVEYLKYLQSAQVLEQKPAVAPNILGFLSAIFSEKPSLASSWASCAAFSGKAKDVVQRALWFSGNTKVISDVFKESPEFAKEKPPRFESLTPKKPGGLDLFWGAFNASGNSYFVSKIIDVLDRERNLSGDEKQDYATRAAAMWSLENCMMRHEMVYRTVVREARTRTGETKERLDAMIYRCATQYKRLQASDGEFSAEVFMTDQQQDEEFNKPSTKQMNFAHKSNVKPEERFSVHILFSGMSLADDLSADVTYTLKIEDPNGKVNFPDTAGRIAAKGKLASRFMLYNPPGYISLSFNNNDIPGTYKFTVMITDNIGKKTLRLEREITLLRS
ncbi:MAG: hypothetical protein HY915_03400 [Desulfovibrio sp.]|nr:hypothetical protein [Desulfovibrio sp.]